MQYFAGFVYKSTFSDKSLGERVKKSMHLMLIVFIVSSQWGNIILWSENQHYKLSLTCNNKHRLHDWLCLKAWVVAIIFHPSAFNQSISRRKFFPVFARITDPHAHGFWRSSWKVGFSQKRGRFCFRKKVFSIFRLLFSCVSTLRLLARDFIIIHLFKN